MKRLLVTLLLLLTVAIPSAADELAVGARAIPFTLTDAVSGSKVAFTPGKGVSVVVFTCNSCPYARAFEPRLVELAARYKAKGVTFFALNPNDESKSPNETLSSMKAKAKENSYPFVYLKDGGSAIARAYGARVTPHVFLVDAAGVVRYRGYVDDSAKPAERTHEGLVEALDALVAGKSVATNVTRAFGCSIKWTEAK